MDKREFLKKTLVLGAGMAVAPHMLSAVQRLDTQNSRGGEFVQPALDYAFDALEPYVDRQTMELHYGKHHAGYTRKFNAALATEGIGKYDINSIFENMSSYGSAVRNNGGGFYNHNLYWKFMSPDGGGEAKGKIGKAMKARFGSFGAFKEQFSSAAGSHFGSGWAWLIVNQDGELEVTSTPNQDNPLMNVAEVRGIPVLNIDVWEHAYYLNYQNQRSKYIEAYWNLIDWRFVDELYTAALAG